MRAPASLGVALAAALVLAGAAPANAESVPLRAWNQEGFGRLVFDWPVPVTFTASVTGNRLIVNFSRPIEASLETAVRGLPDYLAGGRVEGDGRIVIFDLKRTVALRNFRNGNSVALDLVSQAPGAEAAAPLARPTIAESPAPIASPSPVAPAPKPASGSGALPAVRIRTGTHPDRNRLVFDWPRGANYTVEQQGRTVQIAFDQPGEVDFRPVEKTRLRNISTIGQTNADGHLVVQVTIPEGSEIRHFRNGTGMALDVLDPPRQTTAAKAVPRAEPEPAAAPIPTTPAPAARPVASAQTRTAPQTAPPATAKEKRPEATPTTPAAGVPAKPAPTMTATPAPASIMPPSAPAAPTMQATPPIQANAAESSIAVSPAAIAAEASRSAVIADLGQPTAAAVFVRTGYLNVVFDRPVNLEGRIRVEGAATAFGPVEPLPLRGAGGFRMAMLDGLYPSVARDGNAWRISVGPPPADRPASLPVDAQRDFPLGARLTVGVADPGRIISLADPIVGDTLLIVPLAADGQAVTMPYSFVQLRVLPAAQGIVVQPIDDTVTVRPIRGGIEMAVGGGLAMVPSADLIGTDLAPIGPAAPGKGVGLLDLAGWRRGPIGEFTKNRQLLQQAVVGAPEPDRDRARLDLARFYFAHGYGSEASGMLGVVAEHQPDLEGRPEFLTLRGATRLLSGDTKGASDDLGNPALDKRNEALLWRAAAAAEQRDWPAAARDFGRTRELLDGYPDPHYQRLALLATEAAIQAGNSSEATRLLNRLSGRTNGPAEKIPAVQYLRGQIHKLAGRTDEAVEQWRKAIESGDWLYRARSELAMVDLEQAHGKMTPTQAIDRLERLRFAWRGDDLELDVLERLADAYFKAGNFPSGFNTMRQAKGYFPDSSRTAGYDERMKQVFADLYRKDGAAGMSAVDALGLYDQFRDLAPSGTVGDEVTRKLAERLVEIDLLGRAGDLLQQQVDARLQGKDKAQVGMRIAEIRLQDGKPDETLKALDRSNATDIPADLAAERRVLRARALAELKRYGEAIAALKEDGSPSAELMRVDIAWRGSQWVEAASGLAKVIGPPPPAGAKLSQDKADLVLNRAVAMALAGDTEGLKNLRGEFGTAMAEAPQGDTFRMLTRPGQSGNLIDLGAIKSRVGEVGVFQKFLAGYRKKDGEASAVN
jgi:tetratricopeptide (TPR) repeat protein